MAVVKKPYIFQVVGYQNSGKTTTMVNLIKRLSQHNLQIVTIKHHGHGGKPDVLEKDSSIHCNAGALASIVEGDGRLLLQADRKKWSLNEEISLCSFFQPHIILIEGHKKEKFPKIVIVRNSDDHHLVAQLKNICVILYWEEPVANVKTIPQFHVNDKRSFEWITNFIKKQL